MWLKMMEFKNLKIVNYADSILFGAYCDLFCKYALVSYQRSGHTWLRVMLAKMISLQYGVEKMELDLVKMTKNNSEIPKIGIYHSSTPYFKINVDWDKLEVNGVYPKNDRVNIRGSLKRKKIIYLVRDPKDVVVSLFFDLTKRHHLYHEDISKFIKEKYTLRRIIKAMNMWDQEMSKRSEDFLLIRYEDMIKDTFKEMKRVIQFLDVNVSDEIIQQCVEFGSIKNMRKMEVNDSFKDNRLKPKNIADKESYKVRKAKIGGYVDYLNDEDIKYVSYVIQEKLIPTHYK